ncbi:hypothetical protein PVV74_03955 [Roseovarius sp. SK2]|uniref:hypothetical protein n=1 Tax=Roseovarius TaxID=74030 RepID=UPI00237C05E3|nr:hypothetical protein [Roseovarius sp. SK2]MDD9724604.1 hypothetical protein [Roseovarius sp. SK2]
MTDVLRILVSPLLWLAAFSAVYGLHGSICGHGLTGTVSGVALPGLLLGAGYALAVLAQLALLAAHYFWPHPSSDLVRFVSRAGGWVGLVATIWTLLPVVPITTCN